MELDTPSGLSKKLMAAAIAAAVVLGAAGVANAVTAQDNDTPRANAAAQDTSTEDETVLEDDDVDTDDDTDDDSDEQGEHDDADESHKKSEVPLVGSQAADVSAAALAAVPGGTVDRVETDDGGAAFEAHMTDAGGNRVTVEFDEALNVLDIETGKDGGRGDRDDHDDRDGHNALDEATAAKVTIAAEAAVPGGTVLKVEAEDAGYEAHVMGTDGIEVEVYFDADFAVIEISPED